MYKYIFWDFNGTILDDVDLCLDILNQMLIKQKKKPLTMDEYKHVFTFPIIEYYKKAGISFENESFEQLAIFYIENYQPASLECQIYPHVYEMLGYFKDLNYKQILLSASEINNLHQQLNHFDLLQYFDDVLGLDNIHAKSKISIGQAYISKHNINLKECLMIGDTLHDKEVSDALGIDCILVAKGHQAYDVLAVNNNTVVDNVSVIKEYL